jgi:hypothetical protein
VISTPQNCLRCLECLLQLIPVMSGYPWNGTVLSNPVAHNQPHIF